jgi:hypothetical protein
MSAPGYSEEGDQVVLRMTRDDWEKLLLLMGFGLHSPIFATRSAGLQFANRLNAGNPNFTLYQVKP